MALGSLRTVDDVTSVATFDDQAWPAVEEASCRRFSTSRRFASRNNARCGVIPDSIPCPDRGGSVRRFGLVKDQRVALVVGESWRV